MKPVDVDGLNEGDTLTISQIPAGLARPVTEKLHVKVKIEKAKKNADPTSEGKTE